MGILDDLPKYERLSDTEPQMQTSGFLDQVHPYCGWDPLSSYVTKAYLSKPASSKEAKKFLKSLLHSDVKKSYDLPDGVGGETEIKCDEGGCHPYNPIVNGNAPEWLQKYSKNHEEEHCEGLKKYPFMLYGFIARYGDELGLMLYEGLTDYMNFLELKGEDPKVAKAGRKVSGYSPYINIFEDLARDKNLDGIMEYFNDIGKEYAGEVYGENPYSIGDSSPAYPTGQPGGCPCQKAAACC